MIKGGGGGGDGGGGDDDDEDDDDDDEEDDDDDVENVLRPMYEGHDLRPLPVLVPPLFRFSAWATAMLAPTFALFFTKAMFDFNDPPSVNSLILCNK